MDKNQLRMQIKRAMLDMDDQKRAQLSKKACQNLINTDDFKKAAVIMVYLSLPHEVDTTFIILQAWQQNKTVAVPKVSWQQRHMIPVEINSLESGLSVERHGLRNPSTGLPMPLEDIDLVVTPALAFDRHGHRLGRGGSYFDRFFQSPRLKAKKCGLAFSGQLLDEVPQDEHDVPVDCIVTDEGVIDCSSLTEE
ncbi:putative 5-formyltetrahydrofolate cyclo-ligase [Anaerohalosphaera lusitana]|uniref:5-formyltetrahydrofolate cyclo-ligase n=1 Tax=Anaerohalosphaera lusitana TaxID=1936003 RepID=A0A1U9NKT8_9BACT|nr:5-formyltetrahydrofolate cyclo-ligase [Anaerohalosphaera lusitana]AQT68417.1 putative 5-formyltetrahydrofolate cyclo-ligase [Anaerohalosphaera lusitana]